MNRNIYIYFINIEIQLYKNNNFNIYNITLYQLIINNYIYLYDLFNNKISNYYINYKYIYIQIIRYK